MAAHKPARRCAACFAVKDKGELLRISGKDGVFALDLSGKSGGRGAYVCKNRECVKKMTNKKGLDRSFRVSVPKSVYAEITQTIEQIFENG